MSGSARASRGFTIIEVLIVLAIAGLIMVIIFLAVPSVRRTARNEERRRLVSIAYSAVDSYAATGAQYPDSPVEFCTAITKAMQEVDPALGACTPALTAAADGECVLVTGGQYSICYRDRHSDHGYYGELNRINIMHGHWCGTDPTDPDDYPVTAADLTDSKLYRFAVWTPLENNGVACVSSRD